MPEQMLGPLRIQTTLRDYLQIVFRRRYYLMIPSLIIFFTVTVVSFFLPKIYRATAVIMVVEPQTINPLAEAPRIAGGTPPPIQEQLLVVQEQLLSWPHILELIRRLRLDEQVTTAVELERLMARTRKELAVRATARGIYEISFDDKNPVKSQGAVNNLVRIFVEDKLRRQREEASTAVDFIGEQLRLYQKGLEQSDVALYEFKEKNLLNFPGVEENVNIQQLARYEAELSSLNLDFKEAQNEYELIKRQLSGEDKVVMSEALREVNPIVDQLYQQLNKLEMELTALLADATEKHPQVIELRNQITRTQERLTQAMAETVNKDAAKTSPVYQRVEQKLKEMEIKIAQFNARKTELEKIVAEYRQRVDSVPKAEKELARLTRDSRVNESIYSMLKERLEASHISRVELKERGTEYRVLAPARLPLKPIRPNIPMLSLTGLVFGLVLGFGFVFLAEISDHSIHGMEDAKAFLDLPVIAAIPAAMTAAELKLQYSRWRFLWTLLTVFFIVLIIGFIIGLIRAGY